MEIFWSEVRVSLGHVRLWDPWTVARQPPLFMGFSRRAYGVGCHSLLLQKFLIWGSGPGLPHCRQILYPEPPGSPSIFWVY